MIAQQQLERLVTRAALAPSVHNVQPARWRRDGAGLVLLCDTGDGLATGDPAGRDAGLSCGAALEAMVLALSAEGIGAEVALTQRGLKPGHGLVEVAMLRLVEGAAEQGLHRQLERRFTWRGAFRDGTPELFGWDRSDARLVLDRKGRVFLAEANDAASLAMLQDRAFRRELLHWMRLSDRHPRAGIDGMDRAALQLGRAEALAAPLVFGPLWPLLNATGLTRKVTAETAATVSAPVIALFHRPAEEDAVTSGRAYLRMCLEAASLGFAGWPMAAIGDHRPTAEAVCARFGIGPERRLVQAIRFGKPTAEAPPRARRPVSELLLG
ncbi:MAG: Nitroreductase family [Rhodobacteraceae bacterium HLUCCA08]|nr:MAG: Nitroreductase family [Rhodobacteraceae bacterium HLUCCA08]